MHRPCGSCARFRQMCACPGGPAAAFSKANWAPIPMLSRAISVRPCCKFPLFMKRPSANVLRKCAEFCIGNEALCAGSVCNKFVSSSAGMSFSLSPDGRKCRRYSTSTGAGEPPFKRRNSMDVFLYASSFFVLMLGLTYASSPLYKIICQATGLGGIPTIDRHRKVDLSKMKIDGGGPVDSPFSSDGSSGRRPQRLRISFVSSVGARMPWTFKPEQKYVTVRPGETALAFFTATNNSDRDMTGVATYNVVPNSAAPYLNKIQCFCFEEQKLRAGESVDMPVYFYIDPDILRDAILEGIQDIVLSYTFFSTDHSII